MDFLRDGIELIANGQAIVTREATITKNNALGKVTSVPVMGEKKGQANIMGWGEDNKLPNYRERLIGENNIIPSLLSVRRDIILGQGIMAYRRRFENGTRVLEEVEMTPEQQDFFQQLEEADYWQDVTGDLMHHSMLGAEFVMKRDGQRVDSIHAKRMRHLRAEEMDDQGVIRNWYWNGQWGHRVGEKSRTEARKIPAYDRTKTSYPGNFLFVTGDGLLCLDEYYYTPMWWGSEEWIRLANCIPEFHQSNLANGYSIRWHIEIPNGYFKDKEPNTADVAEVNAARTREQQAKKAFIDQLDTLLRGSNQAGKALVTTFDINKSIGQAFPGVKITPLEVNMQDEALLSLFEKSNQANISAQGVHPTLANIETQGKLSSGTEIRNAYLMYLAIKTPLPRKILMRPIELVKKINGWDQGIHFGFRDMVLAPLNEDKGGTAEQTNDTAE